jgi:hypothetical protein
VKKSTWDFVSPYFENGCVPDSFTAVQDKANRTTAFSANLGVVARRTRSRDFVLRGARAFLFCNDNASPATAGRINEWARISGLRVVDIFRPAVRIKVIKRTLPGYHTWNDEGERVPVKIEVCRRVGRPTVAQFLRSTGRRGRWVIITSRHMQASVNGRPKCDARLRSRVRFAARVETI